MFIILIYPHERIRMYIKMCHGSDQLRDRGVIGRRGDQGRRLAFRLTPQVFQRAHNAFTALLKNMGIDHRGLNIFMT